MGFIDGFNVNHRQREQYVCDRFNVRTGKTTGKLSMLQGQKNKANKYGCALPRFQVGVLKNDLTYACLHSSK